MPERPHNDPPTDSLTTMSEAVASPRGEQAVREAHGSSPMVDGERDIVVVQDAEKSENRHGLESPNQAMSPKRWHPLPTDTDRRLRRP